MNLRAARLVMDVVRPTPFPLNATTRTPAARETLSMTGGPGVLPASTTNLTELVNGHLIDDYHHVFATIPKVGDKKVMEIDRKN
mmetsp:Transcript_14770/g.34313  ORF Transcript_14770/g.34313 Transcript_14770/m.34313 type:complete len:84 (+) Transcript_14770:2006-2257(+)